MKRLLILIALLASANCFAGSPYIPWLYGWGTNTSLSASNISVSFTNDPTVQGGSNLVMSIYPMNTVGHFYILFGSARGLNDFGTWDYWPGHGGGPVTSPNQSEFVFTFSGSVAETGTHKQSGLVGDNWWIYMQNKVFLDVSTRPMGYSAPYTWRASGFTNSVLVDHYPGIFARVVSTNGPNGIYEFDFFKDLTYDAWTLAELTNGIRGAFYEGNQRGWILRGGLIQEKTNIVVTNSSWALDFNAAKTADLTIGQGGTITFFTTNDAPNIAGRSTNYEHRVFFLRSGSFTNTFVWPAEWTVMGASAGGSVPTTMNLQQIMRLEMESIGPGPTNKIATVTLGVDNAFTFDPSAVSNFIAAGSGNYTKAQSNAINSLILAKKNHGTWALDDCIYPVPGLTAAINALNLKDTNRFKMTFTATTHDANGITGNGTTSFADTTFVPSSAGGAYVQDSAHLMIYCGTTTPTDVGRMIATVDNTSHRAGIERTGGNWGFDGLNDNDNLTPAIAGISDWRGPAIFSRIGPTTQTFHINGSTSANFGTASTGLPTFSLYLLARNGAGAADNFCAVNLRGASIGAGYTAAQAASDLADWDNYNLQLGRKVP